MKDLGGDISYEFGAFRLDLRDHSLVFGGEHVDLTPKAFDTLAALVKRAGRVVTKDELMELVWPDSFVEEAGLTRNISVLRKALSRESEGKDFIETVPKIGYRFTKAVRRIEAGPREAAAAEPEPASAAENFTWTLFLIAVVTIGLIAVAAYLVGTRRPADASIRSIAVLPFRPLDSSASDTLVEIGLADTLITRLGGLKQLTVKPTGVVRGYAGTNVDPVKAGLTLGVDAVLDGGVQRRDGRLRVTVQLIRMADGGAVWGQAFDSDDGDIFIVQDEIARQVVAALKIRLAAEEQERLFKRYTENTEAFENYIRGRSRLSEYTPEGTLAAVGDFEQALTFDPHYALARSGLATACADYYLRFASEREAAAWGERADRDIAAALALDPDLAETHEALAAVYRKKDFNWEKVLDESSRALELNPSLDQPHYFRAAAFYHLGLLEEAAGETEIAERINPQNRVDALRARGVIALFGRRYADAIASLSEVERLSSHAIADPHIALAHLENGDAERAEQIARKTSGDPSSSASTRASAILASIMAARGDREQARSITRDLEARPAVDHHAAYSIGVAYAQMGETAKAVAWLRRAATTGLPCHPLYSGDPLLAPLQKDPDFQRLLADLQNQAEAARRRFARS
jgi:DNA-binding winged helix-turn-helix (wHTH) protein/TolB-like protein